VVLENMLLKLEHPKILSEVVSIVSELVMDVRFRFDDNGMNLVAVDPATVALTALNIPKSAFSIYEAANEVVGINLEGLKSVLRRCRSGSSLILKTEDNFLRIEIHDKIKRVFHLALIDIEGEQREVPQLEFSNEIEMSSLDFYEAVEDCRIMADSCRFEKKEGKFIIEATGLNSVRLEFSNDEAKIGGTDGDGRYSLEYMQKFARACKVTDKVKLNFVNPTEDTYPLKLEFIIGKIALIFILAPRQKTDG
jgi:proliferating cell nuclear antigen